MLLDGPNSQACEVAPEVRPERILGGQEEPPMTTSATPRMRQMRNLYSAAIGISLLVQLLLPAKIGLALASQETAPDEMFTGVELLRQCKEAVRLADSGLNLTPSAAMCEEYIGGFIAGSIVTGNFYQAQSHSLRLPMCLPEGGITGEQEFRIVEKWLTDHPELLHLNKGILVMRAFEQAFPCKQ